MHANERTVRERLESHTEEHEIVRKLHDVPPHVTHEVRFDGKRAICKRATSVEGDPAMEARIMQFLEATTSVPVPHVLVVGDDYFVAEWDDAVPDDGSVDVSGARTIGAGLATLHDETSFESFGFLEAKDGELALNARESWHETACDFLADRREFLRDGGYEADAEIATKALAFVGGRAGLFRGAGDPVLCHGNYVPDHVGRDGDEITVVIDFEHALVGPGEYDYWRTVIPMCHGPNGVNEPLAEAFREGYESVRRLPPGFDRRAPAYRLLVVVSFFRSLYLQDQHGESEAAERATRFRKHVSRLLDSLDSR